MQRSQKASVASPSTRELAPDNRKLPDTREMEAALVGAACTASRRRTSFLPSVRMLVARSALAPRHPVQCRSQIAGSARRRPDLLKSPDSANALQTAAYL